MKITEAQLDAVLAEALADCGKFSSWFFERTRFGLETAQCVFCRSNNPYAPVKSDVPHPVSGELETLLKERETDVLAVYETVDGRRLALHVENKIEGGSFTPHQARSYQERLQQWKERPNLGDYSDATSILVAPRLFFEQHRAEAEIFDTYISHEELASRLSVFGWPSQAGG